MIGVPAEPKARKLFWEHVRRSVKGFGRAFAVKRFGSAIVKRYFSNERERL